MPSDYSDEIKIPNTPENRKYCDEHDIDIMYSDDEQWLLVFAEDRNKVLHLLYRPQGSMMYPENRKKTASFGVKKYCMIDSEFERIKNQTRDCVVIFKRKNQIMVSVPIDDAEVFESFCKEN